MTRQTAEDWKRDMRIESCTCPVKWLGTMGILYGIPLMGGWVRTLTVRTCPHHGEP